MEDKKFWFNYTYKKVKAMHRMLNFIVGARGCGKTFAFKEDAVKNFLEKGEQFVYMRRYDKELQDKKARELFWPTALKDEYPEHEFTFSDGCYKIDGQVAGFPMALSTAGQMKSIEYDRVTIVCFDEFLISGTCVNGYLVDEVTLFSEAVLTIARMRFVQFFLMSNAISWNNPYFVRYRVPRPEAGQETSKTKSYTLTLPKSEKYKRAAAQSPAGLVFAELDPEFFNYAYNNEILAETNDFIEHKPGDARYLCTIQYDQRTIGVWKSPSTSKIYVSQNVDPKTFFTFALRKEDMKPGVQLVRRTHGIMDSIVRAFRDGSLWYEDLDVKAAFYEMMRYII